jgi:Raf kinase inhibitor-like YbhB/YbcL family protein
MKILSSAFQNNQNIPAKYTCDGENINPPLEFAEVPDNAQSLALICDDPDAVVGVWTHWLVWNIDPKTTQIAENNVPSAARQGKTSSGGNVYHGPCPPSGTHRYFFRLFALDTQLDLPAASDRAQLEEAMKGHIIEEAELIGLYQRGR